ncbi:class I SAM-dependent methyltransferase [Mycobacterium sp. Aquia_216]|uniref:class I SAM-dependent methyltransferase n=1 Tax=Mycobacterium sp. Aquia_216 TaxID=2991729 RepID=UPI00227B8835|nr:class I SAM-dependent methyltransferase [Mycobacterium sp. Aquia_216]WAJ47882.1 class I SAM-dependent methyltransferase [Mycobacterium sp. Aquia_216]
MPELSVIERMFFRSSVWRVGSGITAYTLPVDKLGVDILEIGSGSGAVAQRLLTTNPSLMLTAADVDPRMVSVAKKRLRWFPNASVIQADATDLPFNDSSFDCVVSCLMLHHVVGWEQAVTEIARVLRPGGRFVGFDLTRTPLTTLVHKFERSRYRLIRPVEFSAACVHQNLSAVVRPRLSGQLMSFAATKHRTAEGLMGVGRFQSSD